MTEKSKKGVTAAAGVAGAVVGAGLAVAATRVITDKKLRDKVKGTLSDVSSQVFEAIDQSAGNNQKGGSAARQVKGSSSSKRLEGNKQGQSHNGTQNKESDSLKGA